MSENFEDTFKDLLGDDFEDDLLEDDELENESKELEVEKKVEDMKIELQDNKKVKSPILYDGGFSTGVPTDVKSSTEFYKLTPDQLQQSLFREVDRAYKLNDTLDMIESIIASNRDVLMRKSDAQLMEMYKMFATKQKSAHNFAVKMLEMGIRTKVLGQLLGMDESSVGRKKSNTAVSPVMSNKVKKIANMLRNEMDVRLGILDMDECVDEVEEDRDDFNETDKE